MTELGICHATAIAVVDRDRRCHTDRLAWEITCRLPEIKTIAYTIALPPCGRDTRRRVHCFHGYNTLLVADGLVVWGVGCGVAMEVLYSVVLVLL